MRRACMRCRQLAPASPIAPPREVREASPVVSASRTKSSVMITPCCRRKASSRIFLAASRSAVDEDMSPLAPSAALPGPREPSSPDSISRNLSNSLVRGRSGASASASRALASPSISPGRCFVVRPNRCPVVASRRPARTSSSTIPRARSRSWSARLCSSVTGARDRATPQSSGASSIQLIRPVEPGTSSPPGPRALHAPSQAISHCTVRESLTSLLECARQGPSHRESTVRRSAVRPHLQTVWANEWLCEKRMMRLVIRLQRLRV
jgi:hypothetical protein